MADLGLTDAMDAPEPLFQPVWIPRQVVVDHQMGATLKIHALAGGIVGDHHPDFGIRIERRNRGSARLARDTAVDDDDGLWVADPAAIF